MAQAQLDELQAPTSGLYETKVLLLKEAPKCFTKYFEMALPTRDRGSEPLYFRSASEPSMDLHVQWKSWGSGFPFSMVHHGHNYHGGRSMTGHDLSQPLSPVTHLEASRTSTSKPLQLPCVKLVERVRQAITNCKTTVHLLCIFSVDAASTLLRAGCAVVGDSRQKAVSTRLTLVASPGCALSSKLNLTLFRYGGHSVMQCLLTRWTWRDWQSLRLCMKMTQASSDTPRSPHLAC